MSKTTTRVVIGVVVVIALIALVVWASTPRSYSQPHDRTGPGGDITHYHGNATGTPPVGAIMLMSAPATPEGSRCGKRCGRRGKITRYHYRVRRGSKFIAEGDLDVGEVSLGDVLAGVTPEASGSPCGHYTVYLAGGSIVDRSIIRATLGVAACRRHHRWYRVEITSTDTSADQYWFWQAKGVKSWSRFGCTGGGHCRRWYRRATYLFERDLPGDFPLQTVTPFIAQGGRPDGTWGWDKTGH